MSRMMIPHAFVPGGTSMSAGSVEDRIAPGLRLAYPLPDDDGDDAFRRLLHALALRTGHSPRLVTA